MYTHTNTHTHTHNPTSKVRLGRTNSIRSTDSFFSAPVVTFPTIRSMHSFTRGTIYIIYTYDMMWAGTMAILSRHVLNTT